MSFIPPSPQRQSSADSDNQVYQTNMMGVFRTPSPVPESHLSSAGATSTTPDEVHLGSLSIAAEAPMDDRCDALSIRTTTSTIKIPRPQTPASKHIKTSWHGLASPQTPSNTVEALFHQPGGSAQRLVGSTYEDGCGNNEKLADNLWTTECEEHDVSPFSSSITPNFTTSSGSNQVDHLLHFDSIIPSTSTTGNAELALQPATSSHIRRSTRLRDKTQIQGTTKLAIKHTKRAPEALPQGRPNVTLAEPVVSPFDVAISFDGELPVIHSTEWQLKYPPGGSTHPSYPWPLPDPRLVFHAHFIPLMNGLPNITLVPNLALPLGWRHASWSGLYPVVFDPHQQVFKLTPIGPLPLTSEELHQGGLHDYAPGGKLHPEHGLLPLMWSFSDGSDCEVFNYDSVIWKLPWAHIEGLPEDKALIASQNTAVVPGSKVTAMPAVQLQSRYTEAKDCPDDVFDLQDGWRWLIGIERRPAVTFVPTTGRKWRGTGVQRTTRRTKQPIPALMAMTMAEKEDDNAERYLGNQNTREFCPFKSVATPVNIDITLLQDVDFTLVELLSYFPFHYQWRSAGYRMARAGMSAADISNFVNMTRCLPASSVCSSSSVDRYVFRKLDDEATALQSSSEIVSYAAEHWKYTDWEMTDYPLLALTHGLVELPSGVDAGPLTAIIEWVRKKDRHQTMLSEVPSLLKDANIETLIDSGEGNDPDKEVLARHIEGIKKDRLRVLQEKKQLDAAKEKKTKKRRLE